MLDYLLPDFRLGTFGKLMSGGVLFIVVLIVLVMFFPSVLVVVNKGIRKIVALAGKTVDQ
ncbi:hypothetical protein ACFLU5_10525 [Bacteroidota bacterium]